MGSFSITAVGNLTQDSELIVKVDTTEARIRAARPPMRWGVAPRGSS